MKCVDCDRELSAEVTRQREDGGEALVCDECRTAHLRFVQDNDEDFVDEAGADTQLSPNVVSEGPMCKLPGCDQQVKRTKKSKKYKDFCCKEHYQIYSMMTPSPVSQQPHTSSRGGHNI